MTEFTNQQNANSIDNSNINTENIITPSVAKITDNSVSFIEDTENEQPRMRKKNVTSAELYDVILRHPDWRVVQASMSGNTDSMNPLMYIYDERGIRFEHDFTATALHPHGNCEDILDLLGYEGINNEYGKSAVLIREAYVDSWDEYAMKIRKITLDPSVKWIKLHIEQ